MWLYSAINHVETMSGTENLRRSSRRIQPKVELYKSEQPVPKYNKWSDEEQQAILYCLKVFGHKNIDRINEHLPQKSKEEIRRFLLFAHSKARSKDSTIPNIKYWLERCKGEMEKSDNSKSNYLYMASQVIKYLSVDGLLENHPKPENCGGINFVAAYRLLYQALMGYPLQPVNQATADFVMDCFTEVNSRKNPGLAGELLNLIKKKCGEKEAETDSDTPENASDGRTSSDKPLTMKKPLIVYKRKRPASSTPANAANAPPLEVVFQEEDMESSRGTKYYSLAIGGKKEESPLIVPVPVEIKKTELEEAASKLWSNTEFNPLKLPDEFLQKRA